MSDQLSEKHWKLLREELLKEAERRNLEDAMGGGWGSSGESLKREVQFYEFGRSQTIPPSWKIFSRRILVEAVKSASPDQYQQYLKLKEIFEPGV